MNTAFRTFVDLALLTDEGIMHTALDALYEIDPTYGAYVEAVATVELRDDGHHFTFTGHEPTFEDWQATRQQSAVLSTFAVDLIESERYQLNIKAHNENEARAVIEALLAEDLTDLDPAVANQFAENPYWRDLAMPLDDEYTIARVYQLP